MAKAAELDKDLVVGLKAAKSKRAYFALILKGSNDGALILSKTKVPPADIAAAKKQSGGSAVLKGFCQHEDGKYVFETAKEAPATAAQAVKVIVKRDAGMAIHPEFRVGSDPELLADEGDSPAPHPAAPAPPAPHAPAPPAPAHGGAEVVSRLNAMTAQIKAALAGPNKARVQALFVAVSGQIKNKDFAQAGKGLDELEPLLAPSQATGAADPAAEWKARLAEWTPAIKAAIAAKGAGAPAIAKLMAEAVALAKPGGDMAQALAKLTKCHELANRELASAAPSVNEYGAGYQGFDTSNVHPVLAAALKDSPPQMLTADQWKSIAETPESKKAKETIVKKSELSSSVLEDKGLFAKFSESCKPEDIERRIEQLKSLLEMKDALKLGPVVQKELIGWQSYWQTIKTKPNQRKFTQEPKNQKPITEWQIALKSSLEINSDEKRAECAALLDAPENNRERESVGSVLGEMESIEKHFDAEWERISKECDSIPKEDKERVAKGQAKLEAARKDFLQKKCAKLHELEKTVFAWNDRRTRENLPPSSEAIAMADLVQREHFEITKEVIGNGWPLTVADSDKLSEDDNKKLQETWTKLVEQTGNVHVAKTKEECGVDSEEKANQFYLETLANFARLMGSEGGRHLVNKLSDGKHEVKIKAGEQAECGAGENAFGKNMPQYEAKNQEKPTGKKGTGTPSEVHLVMGGKDSDKALRTQTGAALFAPRFVAMGHELIHALHNSRGVNRGLLKKDSTDEETKNILKEYDDMEEYWTINKGRLSEQVLRDQYGLSAERFGHKSFDPKQAVADAYAENVRVAREMSKRGGQVNQTVTSRKFDATSLNEKTKLAIADAKPELTGPLPLGWNANELTVKQMRGIIGKPIEFKLKQLGWSPFDLPEPLGQGLTIEAVTTENRYHPRSPEGRRLSSKKRGS